MSKDVNEKVLNFMEMLAKDHDILRFAYNKKKFIPGETPIYYSGPVWG